MSRVFCYGFPGLYGGAVTELHHQIIAWSSLGVDIHIIPTDGGYRNEPLYQEMIDLDVTIHAEHEFEAIQQGDAVFGFCNDLFLDNLDRIVERSTNTVFANCMTWLFEHEKQRMQEGLIRTFLYQNDAVRQKQEPVLRELNPDPEIQFLTFAPYFDASQFPFVESRTDETFGPGRISRQDTDKYAANTLHIYEYCVAPVMKRGLFLGFDSRSEGKIGKPPDWIRTAHDHRVVSQQEFYKHCEIVLQPTDTTENWPRIGLEAMASGSVLVVDNRGGWQQMVDHGVTGWLCDHERDFIYYASKMAYEPELRRAMARRARERLDKIAGLQASQASWRRVFDRIGIHTNDGKTPDQAAADREAVHAQ